jgi:ParB/RepB/Spo0J family partition protein
MTAVYSAPNISLVAIEVDNILPSPLNPRKVFDQAQLEELADSIQDHGLLQPIVVRPLRDATIDPERLARGRSRCWLGEDGVLADLHRALTDPDGTGQTTATYTGREWDDMVEVYRSCAAGLGLRLEECGLAAGSFGRRSFRVSRLDEPRYVIIAGERRWRAAKLAGLEAVPARVLEDITDEEHLRLALIENLQRQDLDPIEEAEGYAQLNRIVGLRQAEIAAAVNRSQPAVANAMRLLELPETVRERIRNKELSSAHGVALARYRAFPAVVEELANLAVQYGWTSHKLEGRDILDQMAHRDSSIVRYIENRAPIDTSICEACPYQAYRANKDEGRSWAKGWCLQPEHYEQLAAAAAAERAAQVQATIEQLSEADTPVLALSDLRYDEYERIFEHDVPTGCSADCACRATAVDTPGQQRTICVDPRRYRGLRAADTKREKKEQRRRLDQLAATIEPRVDAIATPGSRELAMLVLEVISHNYSTEIYAAARRHAPDRLPEQRPETWRLPVDVVEQFAQLSPVELTRLGVEVLLRGNMDGHLHGRSSRDPWIDFYLSESTPAEPVELAPIAEASTSGETVECYLCGDVVAIEAAIESSGQWFCRGCCEVPA